MDKQRGAGIFSARLSVYRLLFYTPSAAVVRLLTTNFLIYYIKSQVLFLSGASEDPRMLLPAWVSIATVGFVPQWLSPEANGPLDPHYAVPSYPAKDQHQKGDLGIYRRLFHC